MQSSMGITSQFKKITSFCYVCLSSDRFLEPLGAFREVFEKICDDYYFLEMDSKMLLCWECRGLLKRVKLFTKKVELSQRILNYQVAGDDEKPLISLSNLAASKTLAFDSLQLIEAEPETVPKTEIKEEIEDIPDNTSDDVPNASDDIQDFDYEPLDEIKEENLSDTLLNVVKKTKGKQKSKHFTMVVQSQSSDMVEEMEVNASEIDHWWEKERNSTYVQQLRTKCDLCLMKIPSNKTIENHIKLTHLKTKPYICKLCKKTFVNYANLKRHLTQHAVILKCTVCGFQCCSRPHINYHTATVHCKTVQCAYCPATFHNVRYFYKHYREIHCKFICDYCNKKCLTKRVLERHILRHHSPSQCKICNRTFASYRFMYKHNMIKHERNPTEASFCVQCNIQFDNIAQFKRHILTSVAHAAEKNKTSKDNEKVSCPKCPNVYATKSNMMNHYNLVHSDKKNPRYYCKLCDKFFLNSSKLNDHRKVTHEGYVAPKDKLCSYCGRGFSTNRILVNHIRTHTGERPFHCNYCESKFAQKVALMSHVRHIHLKVKRKDGY